MTTLPKPTDPATLTVLLDALADRLPAPKAAKWQVDAERGLTAGQWKTCTRCNGECQINTARRRNVTCPICKGHGGWQTDAYDEKAQPVTPDSRGASELSLVDFYNTAETICEHSGSPGIERIERLFERSLAGDLEREARQAHPCWQQLEDALLSMRSEHPFEYASIAATHFWGLPLHPSFEVAYPDALVILGMALGDTFRAPRYVLEKADERMRADCQAKTLAAQKAQRWPDREARDAEIRRLAMQGRSERQIVKALGVTKGVIHRAKEAA